MPRGHFGPRAASSKRPPRFADRRHRRETERREQLGKFVRRLAGERQLQLAARLGRGVELRAFVGDEALVADGANPQRFVRLGEVAARMGEVRVRLLDRLARASRRARPVAAAARPDRRRDAFARLRSSLRCDGSSWRYVGLSIDGGRSVRAATPAASRAHSGLISTGTPSATCVAGRFQPAAVLGDHELAARTRAYRGRRPARS